MQNNTSDWFCSCIRHTWRTGSWSVLCLLGGEVALGAGVGGWNILWRCNSRIWSSWVLSPSAREVASTPRGILPVLCFLVVGGGDTLLLKASHWARRGASSNTAKLNVYSDVHHLKFVKPYLENQLPARSPHHLPLVAIGQPPAVGDALDHLYGCHSRFRSSWVLSRSAREIALTPRGIFPLWPSTPNWKPIPF